MALLAPDLWLGQVTSLPFAPLLAPRVPSFSPFQLWLQQPPLQSLNIPQVFHTLSPTYGLDFQMWPRNTCADSVECVKSGHDTAGSQMSSAGFIKCRHTSPCRENKNEAETWRFESHPNSFFLGSVWAYPASGGP